MPSADTIFFPSTHVDSIASDRSTVTLGTGDTVILMGSSVETIADGFYPAGSHTIQWDGSAFPDGIYYSQFKTDNGFNKTIELQKQ